MSNSPFPVAASVAGWLASINLMLGIFNLLPGLPLDGGRVLRGLIWRFTGDQSRATRLTGNAGCALGYLLTLLGFTLPSFVDAGKISAEFKDGMLRVTMAKREDAKPKQIEVNVK